MDNAKDNSVLEALKILNAVSEGLLVECMNKLPFKLIESGKKFVWVRVEEKNDV